MKLTASDLATRLQKAKHTRSGWWQACCPSHDDDTPSLAFTDGDRGIVIKCHAGCNKDAVLDAVGLTWRDFSDGKKKKMTPAKKTNPRYDYHHPDDGSLIYTKIKRAKGYRIVAADGSIGKPKDAAPVLYRAHHLARAEPGGWVFVVEGEKDADTVADLGFVATTKPNGATSTWEQAYTSQIKAASPALVVVLADDDDVGRKGAQDTVDHLTAAGLDTVGPITFYKGDTKRDVTDWVLDDGGNAALLTSLVDCWDPSAEIVDYWRTRLTKTKRGQPMAHTRNVDMALEYHPDLKGALRYNEFARVVEVHHRVPGVWERGPFPRPLLDVDVTALLCWVEEHITGMAIGKVSDAVHLCARRHSYDPLRDWVLGLPHVDDTSILDTWLIDYLGCADTPWVRTAGRKWLLGATARALTPAVKVDVALILEGQQGAKKSTAMAALCPRDDWFSDNPGPMGSRESAELIQGCWIVEVGELVGFSKHQIEDVKRFLSTTTDRYRAPFARLPESHPRRCVFVGTTNESEYLKDATGNRRFWPVTVEVSGPVDVDGIRAARDSLFAAARQVLAAAADDPLPPWVLTRAEEGVARAEQSERMEIDPWQDIIEERWGNLGTKHTLWLTFDEVFSVLNIDKEKRSKREKGRIARILTSLGGTRARRRIDGVKVRGFEFSGGIGGSECQDTEENVKDSIEVGHMSKRCGPDVAQQNIFENNGLEKPQKRCGPDVAQQKPNDYIPLTPTGPHLMSISQDRGKEYALDPCREKSSESGKRCGPAAQDGADPPPAQDSAGPHLFGTCGPAWGEDDDDIVF